MTLSIVYVWASIEARRPVLAGICVALGFATRPPWLVVPLFLFEAVRAVGGRDGSPRAEVAPRAALVAAQVRRADRRRRRGAGRLQLRALPKSVRVRAQIHAGPVAGPDVPLRPLQLPLPVAQPGRRAGAPAAHHDPLPVREGEPARDEPARHLAQPRLHRDAAGARARSPRRSGSPSWRRRSRRCSTKTPATCSGAIASASTT